MGQMRSVLDECCAADDAALLENPKDMLRDFRGHASELSSQPLSELLGAKRSPCKLRSPVSVAPPTPSRALIEGLQVEYARLAKLKSDRALADGGSPERQVVQELVNESRNMM